MRALFIFLFSILFISKSYSQAPTADFSANTTTVCANNPILFSNQSSSSTTISSFSWDFGDGNSSNIENPSHSYSLPGTYTVTLVVVDVNGSADAEVKANYITVIPSPLAGFSISGLGCTVPLSVIFNNTTPTSPNYDYNWDFGNGQTSNIESPPSVTYNNSGSYDVILTVSDNNNGCSSSDTQNIVVSNFQAGISAPSIGCVGSPINFQDNSTAGANAWTWNFGGLATSNNQNPTYVFNTPGVYDIQLSSENTNSGCSGSASVQITIEPTPTPSFNANPTSDCAPAQINFSNTSVGGTSYDWDFGNGQTYSGNTPPPQTYNLNGQYTVSLTMTTPSGCSGTTTQQNMIDITNVQALFTADSTGGCDPLTVQFSDSSITPNPNNPIVSWEWDFGNGQTHSGANPPAQTYTVGLYDVSLIVQTQSGCSDTISISDYITVGLIDSVAFSVNPIVECAKTDIQFTNLTGISVPYGPNEVTYLWDFSEGTSTQVDPLYQFTSDTGYFDVTLTVNFRGCIDSIKIDSAVYILAPIANFTPDQTLICNPASLPANVHFTDDATHGVIADDLLMVWQWGDGTPNDTLDDPDLDDIDKGDFDHQYSNYGTYTVQQVIYNYTTGCEDSTTQTIHVSWTDADFSISNDSVCKGDSLFMFDLSTSWMTPPSPHPVNSWSYDMGNGQNVSSGANPGYTYSVPGDYLITLTATNSVGCSDDATQTVKVLQPPFAMIIPDNNLGCSPFLVNFTNSSIAIGNGVPLSSFEFLFSDDSSTIITNNLNTPVNHIFNGEGIFYASLVAIDQFGCQSDPATIPITITKPSAFFNVNNVICNNDSIFAINGSSGVSPLSYEWFLDQNQISLDTNVSEFISETGLPFGQSSALHTLQLITTDGNGCKDTVSNIITVSIPTAVPDCTFSGASINSNGDYDCPPLFGVFQDSSFTYGNITDWQWSFGNGNQSVLQNPSNTYVETGTYTLYFSITDEYGCIDDTTLVDFLTIGGPTGNPDWLQNPGICSQGAAFIINNPSSIDSVIWDMGDGNFIYDSINFNYNYDQSGTYTANVTLFDSLGCEINYILNPVTVQDDGLNANFIATPNPAEQNDLITFTDQSSAANSSIINWIWDFTDSMAISNTNSNQVHSYSNSGSYDVVLKIIDDQGCEDSYMLTIFVNDPEIWIPNVFTPNGDLSNDIFSLPFDAFKSFDLTITNRWGNIVCEKTNHTGMNLWDGNDMSGNKCSDGVYFYRITGEMYGGTLVNQHGFVTLVQGQ